MKQPLVLLLLAATVGTPIAHAQLLPQASTGTSTATDNGPLDRIVAVVEDSVILQSELDDAVRAVQQQYASNPSQLPPQDVLQRQVLDRLILMRLQVQRASDQGIKVSDADVDQAVAGVAQQNKMTRTNCTPRWSSRARALPLSASSWPTRSPPSACTKAWCAIQSR